MKFKCFIAILAVSFMVPALANVEVLTQSDFEIIVALQQFQWRKTLNSSDLDIVATGLKSDKDTVVDEALKVVLLHQIQSVLPILEQGVGVSYGYSRLLGEQLKDALQSGQDVRILYNNVFSKYSGGDYLPLRKTMQSALVINEVKNIRANLSKGENLRELKLTEFENKLVIYSQIPASIAVKKIVDELSKAKIAGSQEYQLVNILRTYDYEMVSEQVLTKLQNFQKSSAKLSGVQSIDTKYANRLFLRYLQPYVGIASAQNLEHLKSTINTIKTTDEDAQLLIKSINNSVSSN